MATISANLSYNSKVLLTSDSFTFMFRVRAVSEITLSLTIHMTPSLSALEALASELPSACPRLDSKPHASQSSSQPDLTPLLLREVSMPPLETCITMTGSSTSTIL